MTTLARHSAGSAHRAARTVPGEALVAILLGLLALDNIVLLHFLGLSPVATSALAGVICAGLVWRAMSCFPSRLPIPIDTLATAFAAAVAILALGGEGRLFYANPDWQVRDAVLSDMATHPWPFAYILHGQAMILRAPLGMYLLPALLGGADHHDAALLLFNAVRLGFLLALTSTLFERGLQRRVALFVALTLSGWDVLGIALRNSFGANLPWDHIEAWDFGLQFSSNLTQAFWAPNHALAGWICAVFFALWQRGKAPIGWFAASVPLVAIWSPLAVMGTVPFVVLAGLTALRRREIRLHDLVMAAVALAVAMPALFYMHSDAAQVATKFRHVGAIDYGLQMLFEVMPLLVPPLFSRTTDPSDRVTLRVVFVCLVLAPFIQVGTSSDFQMRASIMPLALLSIFFAAWLNRQILHRSLTGLAYGILALSLGAVTPALELRRALVNGPSPAPLCSLVGVWKHQTGLVAPVTTYLARAGSLPVRLQAIPMLVRDNDQPHCWVSDWINPQGFK